MTTKNRIHLSISIVQIRLQHHYVKRQGIEHCVAGETLMIASSPPLCASYSNYKNILYIALKEAINDNKCQSWIVCKMQIKYAVLTNATEMCGKCIKGLSEYTVGSGVFLVSCRVWPV